MPKGSHPASIGPYLLVRQLGRGGMGVVYLARSPLPGHPLVALKRLRMDLDPKGGFAERFEHEARLAVLLEHPHVVRTLEVGSVARHPYVVSELIRGKDVDQIGARLGEGVGAPVTIAVRILLDALAALAYVHDATDASGAFLRLVHRDVTAGNLIVGYDGKTRLADFGLAKSILNRGVQLTETNVLMGTPQYLAPEVVNGEGASQLADLYGLGVTMYALLTGMAVYDGTPEQIVTRILERGPVPVDRVRSDLPEWLSNVVASLLERDPRRRMASARRAIAILEAAAKSHGALIDHETVGTWLTEIFRREYEAEAREFGSSMHQALPPADTSTPTRIVASAALARPAETPRPNWGEPELLPIDGQEEPTQREEESSRSAGAAIGEPALLPMSFEDAETEVDPGPPPSMSQKRPEPHAELASVPPASPPRSWRGRVAGIVIVAALLAAVLAIFRVPGCTLAMP